jgi:hypothetical protein
MIRNKARRQVLRYPVRLEVKVLKDRPAAGVLVVDLSSLGARLEGDHPLSPGLTVDFTIRLPDYPVDSQLSGQVMWSRPLVETPGRFQMGVKFFATNWELDRLGREGRLGEPLPAL